MSSEFAPADYRKMAYPVVGENTLIVNPNQWRAQRNDVLDAIDSLPQDIEIKRLVAHYQSADSIERERLRANSSIASPSLLLFSERYSIRSYRKRDPSLLRVSMLALSIEDLRNDVRETISWLILCQYVCQRLSADFQNEITNLQGLSSSRFVEFLSEFLRRPKDWNTLRAIGRKETVTANGPFFSKE